MPLRWDPLLVRELARELDARLAGARVRALRLDGKTRRLALLLRDETLAWGLHPSEGSPLLLPPAEPAGGDLPLRGRIRRVRAPEDERILVLDILPLKGGPARDLVVELLGNQWNAVVVERPSGTVRHVLVRREGARPVRVGIPYAPPPPSLREAASEPVEASRWMEVLEPVPPPQRRRTLVDGFAWTSPLNAGALVDAHPDPRRALESGYDLWRRLAFGPPAPAPVLLGGTRGPQPYPWPLPGEDAVPFPTLLDAFRAAAEARSRGDGATASSEAALLPADVLNRLEGTVEALLRRATRIEAELDGLEDERALRSRGDLLLARFSQIPVGASRVTLADFDGASVTLELDPARTLQDNATDFYDRAAKVARARNRLPRLLEEARARAASMQDLLARAYTGAADLEEVRGALPRPPAGEGRGVQDPGPSLPYRSYRSSGGLEIRVGRGARSNDDLTFHHAAPGDVWLHARHAAGAHVVLRWSKPGNPPARDLHEAAILAALHSRARTSGSVPVDWTFRKYVRKPRGAPPGAVTPDRMKTVMVRPDADLLERLATE